MTGGVTIGFAKRLIVNDPKCVVSVRSGRYSHNKKNKWSLDVLTGGMGAQSAIPWVATSVLSSIPIYP